MKGHSFRGFTIVELLIVIVVIAILAAIVIVSYNGITKNALQASMKSDLQTAASELELENHHSNAYPLTADTLNGGQGLKVSGQNQLSYALKSYGFCISVSNPSVEVTYRMKGSEGRIEEGQCTAMVSTIAGSSSGYVDGASAVARFRFLDGIAVDSAGNAYVSDYGNNRIRKISPSGIVTTLAGSGTAGYVDDTGTAAQFNNPYGIAVDSAGMVYVADQGNNRIRKITPAGVVTTLAGSAYGYADGTGAAARFRSPRDVALDTSGNVYVADTGSFRIRKITPAGVVTSLAGSGAAGSIDGTGIAAQFSVQVRGITVDSTGNIYVVDGHRIRKISSAGVVTTLAGSTMGYVDGVGAAAKFYNPTDVAVDASGSVYVSDTDNYRIRKVSPFGVVTTIAGSTKAVVDGTDIVARFEGPRGIAIDGDGNIYLTDVSNGYRIRKIEQ